MPIKEYICHKESCKEQGVIELLISSNDNEPTCPNCNTALQRTYTTGPQGFVRGSHTPCTKKYVKS